MSFLTSPHKTIQNHMEITSKVISKRKEFYEKSECGHVRTFPVAAPESKTCLRPVQEDKSLLLWPNHWLFFPESLASEK